MPFSMEQFPFLDISVVVAIHSSLQVSKQGGRGCVKLTIGPVQMRNVGTVSKCIYDILTSK